VSRPSSVVIWRWLPPFASISQIVGTPWLRVETNAMVLPSGL